MKNIYSSASKLVFVLIAMALILLTAFNKVEAKDFIVLASMAFTYYFTRQQPNTTTSSTDTKAE